jgi:hypothetical protein
MAKNKYKVIPIKVKLFNVRSAELGDPNKLVFVAKLAKLLFLGDRTNIIIFKNMLSNIHKTFIIKFILLEINLQFQKLL